ncbi:hypothetical protein LshimejAT787_0701700 [Lyophyllum shimeji]|uniref:Uncharacterized protein n=1 Tax=Lyophyllum shimeji TaxID=47721 RepID=A0A9P3PNG9_LYOSH|nr:hypothetical protein LshimejAT787_0701700 [Lyophyllum shimeji]
MSDLLTAAPVKFLAFSITVCFELVLPAVLCNPSAVAFFQADWYIFDSTKMHSSNKRHTNGMHLLSS